MERDREHRAVCHNRSRGGHRRDRSVGAGVEAASRTSASGMATARRKEPEINKYSSHILQRRKLRPRGSEGPGDEPEVPQYLGDGSRT